MELFKKVIKYLPLLLLAIVIALSVCIYDMYSTLHYLNRNYDYLSMDLEKVSRKAEFEAELAGEAIDRLRIDLDHETTSLQEQIDSIKR